MANEHDEKTSTCEVILNELGHVKKDIEDLQKEVAELKVRVGALDISVVRLCEQFIPVKRVVYGMVGVILTSVLGGALLLIIKMKG